LIRVLVSAKSAITRAGLESLVRANDGFEVVGSSYRDGIPMASSHEQGPDVILLDAGEAMPAPPAYLHDPGAPALVLLVGDVSRSEARRFLHAGVLAILSRDSTEEEIIAAIEAAAAGLVVFSAAIIEELFPVTSESAESDDFSVVEPLTSRESQVLSLIAEGVGNKEIASRLHISGHTVKFHVSSILAKLGAATRTEAVTRGYREGLILM
jgi:two-component system, NarL family, response regulator YdfI